MNRLRVFLNTEAAGGIVLLGATLAALLVANSPVADSYESLWRADVRFAWGGFEVAQDIRHWINDGLMTLFFFVVSLEIKRELVVGELNDKRRAMIPVVAALGGMAVPALIYAAFNAGGSGASGWGIPMATDIAFAVGVLALLSDRIPSGLKVFLLSLAIVDDIGAILVIALFYSGGIEFAWLITAAGLLALVVLLRRLKIHWVPVYVVVGIAVWLATLESGIHATIAGAALGLLTPARPSDPRGSEAVSVAESLEHLLHPWTSYVVIPLFALANAGIVLSVDAILGAFSSSVATGIVGGLVVGKIIGISGATWLAVRLNLGRLPEGVHWRHVVGASTVAGIGFTVSIFISALAFDDKDLVAEAKMGVFLASLVAGLAGAAVLAIGHRKSGHQGMTQQIEPP